MKQKKVNCVQKVEMLFIEACYSYKCYSTISWRVVKYVTQQSSEYRATIVPWNKLAMNPTKHLFFLRQLADCANRPNSTSCLFYGHNVEDFM